MTDSGAYVYVVDDDQSAHEAFVPAARDHIATRPHARPIERRRIAREADQDDLAPAIRLLAEHLAFEYPGHGARMSLVVSGAPRHIPPIVRREIFCIAGEALRNAFRHAQATRIEVELRYECQHLSLRVRDNGKGIDAKHLRQEGRQGHYGLCGISERAILIGGRLGVWSAPGCGTEVDLRVPATVA